MKQSLKDKAKGTLHEVKGSVKEKVGRVDEQSPPGSRRPDRKDRRQGPTENRPSGENSRNVSRSGSARRGRSRFT